MSYIKKDGALYCVVSALILILVFSAGMLTALGPRDQNMKKETFIQEPLPYEMDALEPYISSKTLKYHYGKHHSGYVSKANKYIEGSGMEGKTPEEIIKKTAGKKEHLAIFNNAAQAWNHSFFWKSMKPGGGGKPSGRLAEMINESFGSVEEFKEHFKESAGNRFASGWVWLVQDGDKLKVMNTQNADTPLAHGLNPLLTADVWEHAYYLDYQNRRGDFIDNYLEQLVNWDFAASQLK